MRRAILAALLLFGCTLSVLRAQTPPTASYVVYQSFIPTGTCTYPAYLTVVNATASVAGGVYQCMGTPLLWTRVGPSSGVQSIDGSTGVFTFSGPGVSHSGNAYTFSGAGSGIGSITWAVPSWMTASPGTISASGTQTFGLATGQTANLFLATPNGSTGAVGLRAIVAADVPTLNQNTTGTAANLSGTPALPNGTTATTQTVGDNTTKIATTAFVLANAGSSAFSSLVGGTNTTAAMVVGTGASLAVTGSGTIAATSAPLSGVSGLGTGVATFLGTPSSANLASAVTDETGTGVLVFNASPTFTGTVVIPALTVSGITGSTQCLHVNTSGVVSGTGSDCGAGGGGSAFNAITSGTNTTAAMLVGTGASLGVTGSGTITATAVPVGGVSGLGTGVATFLATPSSANFAAAVTGETGTGAVVFATSPTLVTPVLGVAAATSLQLTGITGSTQCLHVDTSGNITGTGSECGSAGGGSAFSTITGGTNTSAAMLVGTGASLGVTGSGTITATAAPASGLTGTTLASGVVTSSLTSTGTLTGGATGAGFTVALGTSTVTGILGAVNGGTGNGFFAVSGPTTATRTFTFPNASATVLTSNAAVTAAQGGTGVANTATLTLGSSNQNWATLGTGIVKNTTTTGAISNAASSDVIGLWSGTCSSSTFLRGDGSCQAPGGSGNVTAGGTLTSNAIVLGAGTQAVAVVSGITTDGSSKINLGISGTSVGAVVFNNTTSGSVTLQPVTGALGSVTASLPANTGTVAELNLAQTWSALQTFGTNISIGGTTASGATGSGNVVFATSPTLTTPNLGTPSTLTLTNATGLPTAGLANNAVTSAKMAVANTYRTCDIPIGDTSGSAIASGQLGPQSRICFIPAAATIVEMDVNADGGTPNIIVGKNHAGTVSNIVSAALATAASGGIACSNTGGTTGINGATTCSSTLQNTSLAAGDYLELVSGTPGGTAKFMVVHVIYTVN